MHYPTPLAAGLSALYFIEYWVTLKVTATILILEDIYPLRI